MNLFILKLVGIICTTVISLVIIIARKDDLEITSVILAIVFEIISYCIIYIDISEIIKLIL